ncbi:MAG TPA: DUF1501 domain-containing protein [Thermoanaerobaculia bacterium]|nr:DUF1501 domain-containing protein [Thermoanaerobaculia bacterium]
MSQQQPPEERPRGATRRQFMRQSVCATVGMTSLASTLFDLRRVAAAAPLTGTDYKALVCVFLYGGNDSNNMLVPYDPTDYASYAAVRQGLALPRNTLLPINLLSGGDGRLWSLHPNLPGLQSLFGQQHMAIVANVGPLVAPVTIDQWNNGTAALPPQLFSHSDQTLHWQTSIPDQPPSTGWGGRVADMLRALNGTAQISMSMSLAGSNTFQVGNLLSEFQVQPGGTPGLANYTTDPTDPQSNALRALLQASYGNLFVSGYRDVFQHALSNDLLLQSVFASLPPLQTQFPQTDLGTQLQTVAQLIEARTQLSQQRQVFFVATSGFDTHGGQLPAQVQLLQEVNDALAAFYAATVEMQVQNGVTAFTASDFGRTFLSNGDGSDHGWGSHHLVVGGAVQGGSLYGRVPALAIDGPDDTGDGRWIPTTSVDEYSATLAKWFGVSATDMPTVFPNLYRFNNPDLGFMGA